MEKFDIQNHKCIVSISLNVCRKKKEKKTFHFGRKEGKRGGVERQDMLFFY